MCMYMYVCTIYMYTCVCVFVPFTIYRWWFQDTNYTVQVSDCHGFFAADDKSIQRIPLFAIGLIFKQIVIQPVDPVCTLHPQTLIWNVAERYGKDPAWPITCALGPWVSNSRVELTDPCRTLKLEEFQLAVALKWGPHVSSWSRCTAVNEVLISASNLQ